MFTKKPRHSLMLPPPVPGIRELYDLISPYGANGKHWLIKNYYRTAGSIEETIRGVHKDIEDWERTQRAS